MHMRTCAERSKIIIRSLSDSPSTADTDMNGWDVDSTNNDLMKPIRGQFEVHGLCDRITAAL